MWQPMALIGKLTLAFTEMLDGATLDVHSIGDTAFLNDFWGEVMCCWS
jgi:hypothetical protein